MMLYRTHLCYCLILFFLSLCGYTQSKIPNFSSSKAPQKAIIKSHHANPKKHAAMVHKSNFDLCVYGGTSSGVVAAISAQRMGKKVILIEPLQHLGGMSASGLGETDIGNKNIIKGIARNFYTQLGHVYGKPEVWQFEPKEAEKIFENWVYEARIEVMKGYRIVGAAKKGARLEYLFIQSIAHPLVKQKISAKMFIDASYEGDLMAKSGVSYTYGREPNSQYRETLNGVQIHKSNAMPDSISPYKKADDPNSGLVWGVHDKALQAIGMGDKKIQAYNFRLCLTQNQENSIPITRPEKYDSTQFELLRRIIVHRHQKGWKQKLEQLYLRIMPIPNQKSDINNKGGFSTDLIGGSHSFVEANYAQRDSLIEIHRNYTKGLLYFLGHDPAIPQDLKNQMLSWSWPKDEFTDHQGFPFQLYIREARRLLGGYVMTENNCRGKVHVTDPIGMAAYNMDSHHCDRQVKNGYVVNEGDVQERVAPYSISYKALLPKAQECSNLIVPVCLSASHIAYGSIRMEPVFMVLGQVAGMAASFAIDQKKTVQRVSFKDIVIRMTKDPILTKSRY